MSSASVFALWARFGARTSPGWALNWASTPMQLLQMINAVVATRGSNQWSGEGAGLRCALSGEAGRGDPQ
jgi:hypothetical protein